ncbi:MAG: FtsW/RodA/SpoVE family cell cycle protein [Actinomycetota bacterium]|jgi:cell division protein FtsW (lipid II flippase)|nr:FtsW/RodA/SpoVE family cell cycle protein [Actinomycetota bacterium]
MSAVAAAAKAPADARRKANSELGLLILALLVTIGAYVLVDLAQTGAVPPGLAAYGGAMAALGAAAHLASRRLASGADPVLLPLAFLLNGLGLVMVRRLDFAEQTTQAPAQTIWTVVAIVVFILTLVVVRDHRMLDDYRYLVGIGALAFLLMPLLPGIGKEVNGARIWLGLGGLSFQPGEVAKLGLVTFFASYLAEKRALLTVATNRLGPLMVPPARAFGPILAVWGVSLAVLVFQKDLGLSLLVFGIFVAMLYVATARLTYVLLGLALFSAGAYAAWTVFSHVQSRISTWLDPWSVYDSAGYQVAQSLFAMGTGGIFGVGLGQGRPDIIPEVNTDFIFAAFGEEIGLLGTTALLLCFFLFVGRGFTIAMRSRDDFGQLLAAGLTFLFGLQVFVILGGVTQLLPLTGVTLPFMSYGGSSLLANYALVALLLRVSASSSDGRGST